MLAGPPTWSHRQTPSGPPAGNHCQMSTGPPTKEQEQVSAGVSAMLYILLVSIVTDGGFPFR